VFNQNYLDYADYALSSVLVCHAKIAHFYEDCAKVPPTADSSIFWGDKSTLRDFWSGRTN